MKLTHVLEEFDLAIEDIIEVLEIWGQAGVAVQILMAEGPGGGWPLANLYGTKESLENWIDKYYNTGDLNANNVFKKEIKEM